MQKFQLIITTGKTPPPLSVIDLFPVAGEVRWENCLQQRDTFFTKGALCRWGRHDQCVLFIYLFIYLLTAQGRSPQGFSQVQISHKSRTIQNMHICINIKHTNIIINPKVSPFDIALVQNGK